MIDCEIFNVLFLVQKIIEKIYEYQQMNMMMFTRIMDKFCGDKTQTDDVPLTHPKISVNDFPCASSEKLKELSTLCLGDPIAMKILVLFNIFL